ncbi:hypothetical protein C0J52_08920, partial [Blattella germanica]
RVLFFIYFKIYFLIKNTSGDSNPQPFTRYTHAFTARATRAMSGCVLLTNLEDVKLKIFPNFDPRNDQLRVGQFPKFL